MDSTVRGWLACYGGAALAMGFGLRVVLNATGDGSEPFVVLGFWTGLLAMGCWLYVWSWAYLSGGRGEAWCAKTLTRLGVMAANAAAGGVMFGPMDAVKPVLRPWDLEGLLVGAVILAGATWIALRLCDTIAWARRLLKADNDAEIHRAQSKAMTPERTEKDSLGGS